MMNDGRGELLEIEFQGCRFQGFLKVEELEREKEERNEKKIKSFYVNGLF